MRGFYSVLLGLGLGLVGCASEGASGTSEALYAVSGSIVERADLLLDTSIDARPLTEAQLIELGGELGDGAVPVALELSGDRLVAVDRLSGATVASWPVLGTVDLSTATPIGNELENTPTGPVYTPDLRGSLDVGGLPGDLTGRFIGDTTIVIDFGLDIDRTVFEEPELWQDLNDSHPGCA
jgi:hypothetical protein